MSKLHVEAALLLLRDHFGTLVADVGGVLLRGGSLPLPLIVFRSKLGVSKVKQALTILIQHHLVIFACASGEERSRNVEYRCLVDRVLLLARCPQYMIIAKKLYGEAAELIVEELLAHGQLSLSQCVQRVTRRLDAVGANQDGCSMKPEDVKHRFVNLVETHFLCRCPELVSAGQSEVAETPCFRLSNDPYLLPDAVDIFGVEKPEGTSQRKRKLDEADGNRAEPDAEILWRVNFDRFHEYLRDQYLLIMARNRIDQNAEEVLRAALRLSELRSAPSVSQSAPLSFEEIFKLIPDAANLVKAQVEQYLMLLSEDRSRMIRKTGERGGGQFVIDFANAMKAICLSTIESIIQERHGSKALRIFNLLLAKGYLEQNEIETFAMLPSKEGKELTYRLLTNNILSTKEVPKTNDFAPSRTFYLFHVDLYQVVRLFCDKSYKIISNLILRRYHENEEHKALLERQERLEAVIANIRVDPSLNDELKEQHMREAEDVYLTLAEKETLEKYRRCVASLQQAETEVDETVLIFNLYTKYSR